RLAREGFIRARIDGQLVELAANVRVKLDPKARHTIEVVVDRLVIDDKVRVRLADSVETALRWGDGRLLALQQPGSAAADASPRANKTAPANAGGYEEQWIETLHSTRNYSPVTGRSYETPTPKHFSFNSPFGACPVCHGLGQKLVFDPNLIVPDKQKSIEGGAVLPWRRGGKRM